MQQKLKQKHIESFLQDIEGFEEKEKDKWELEQHMTPPDIAASILFNIYQREPNISNYIVGDFGCGTGMLTAGLIYCGAFQTIGLEFDGKYISKTKNMLEEKFEDSSIFDLIQIDMTNFNVFKDKIFDMVLMNPPFGTKKAGIDIQFLEQAIKSCRGNIYSLHKTSTADFLKKKADEWGYKMEVLDQFNFPLPKRFNKYHKKEIAFTEVDFIVFSPI